MRRRVDFPEPFGPIKPTHSPSEIPREMFSKSGFAPKVLLTDWQLRSIGIPFLNFSWPPCGVIEC